MTDTMTTPPASRELPLEPGGSVDIVLAASNLRIRGIDGDRVIVRTRDGGPLGDQVRIEAAPGMVRIRDGEGSVRLGPLVVHTRRSPDLDIDLPRAAAITLRTVSGDVEALEVGGASRWASTSGDLHVAVSAGPVQLESMSGDAVVEASAAITLVGRTVSGDLKVRAPRLDGLDASTTSGDVRVEGDLAAGNRHAISSVSGDVDVITGSPVRLEAQTIAGDVRANGPHATEGGRGRRTLVVGNGSVGLSVRTTSGDVRLRVLGGLVSAAPTAPAATPTAQGVPQAPAVTTLPEAPVPPIVPLAPIAPAPIPLGAPGGAAEPRPIGDEDTQAWNAPEPAIDRREAERLGVLRALERGDMDVETASRRLEALDEAGPRSFRGWC
jgi:DUF4097 and DUF4098 domain-containing protein YvlB